jgi:hypothetical protein
MNGDASSAPCYSGIGAKDTPAAVLAVIEKIGIHMARHGYILRSGGAMGASTVFEQSCDKAKGKKEIYLPWQGFNKNRSMLFAIPDRALGIAKEFNPVWTTIDDASRKVQARYAMVLLGKDLAHPSAFVICYTKEGKLKGGTGQALQVAQKHGIPIFNLGAFESDIPSISSTLKEFLNAHSIPCDDLVL